jgi:hypothetical protein
MIVVVTVAVFNDVRLRRCLVGGDQIVVCVMLAGEARSDSISRNADVVG